MDNNTFQLAIAVVATLQVVALAIVGVWSREAARLASDTSDKVVVVHDLVNSLSEKKDAAITDAATKAGELAGRDFEAAKHTNVSPASTPLPVTIVGSETTIPVHEKGAP